MLFFFIIVEIKARVDSMWEQMNKGVSSKTLKGLSAKRSPAGNKNSKKPSNVKIHILLLHNEAAQNIGKISLTFFSPSPLYLELDCISWYGVKEASRKRNIIRRIQGSAEQFY